MGIFMKKLLGALLLVFFIVGESHAQPPPASVTALRSVAPSPSAQSPAFNAETATNAYMAELTPAQRANSDAYFEGGYWLILWDLLVALGVAWLLLGSRLSARMRNLAERITRWRWLQTAIYAVQYIVLTTLATLPWSLYEGYFREHQYGLSNLSLGGWFGEQAKGLLVGLILGTLALVVIYAVIRKAARRPAGVARRDASGRSDLRIFRNLSRYRAFWIDLTASTYRNQQPVEYCRRRSTSIETGIPTLSLDCSRLSVGARYAVPDRDPIRLCADVSACQRPHQSRLRKTHGIAQRTQPARGGAMNMMLIFPFPILDSPFPC